MSRFHEAIHPTQMVGIYFSQTAVVADPLPGISTLGWGVWCGDGIPCSFGGTSVADISLLIIIHHTEAWGQLFGISIPPTTIDMASSLYP